MTHMVRSVTRFVSDMVRGEFGFNTSSDDVWSRNLDEATDKEREAMSIKYAGWSDAQLVRRSRAYFDSYREAMATSSYMRARDESLALEIERRGIQAKYT